MLKLAYLGPGTRRCVCLCFSRSSSPPLSTHSLTCCGAPGILVYFSHWHQDFLVYHCHCIKTSSSATALASGPPCLRLPLVAVFMFSTARPPRPRHALRSSSSAHLLLASHLNVLARYWPPTTTFFHVRTVSSRSVPIFAHCRPASRFPPTAFSIQFVPHSPS